MPEFLNTGNCVACSLKFDIFKDLTKDELEYLNSHRTQVKFNSGEILFKQGAELTHVACITKGRAKVYIEGLNKKNLLLNIVQSGDVVAGPGMFQDNRLHYSVSAIDDMTTCFIQSKVFSYLVKHNPDFALTLLNHINGKGIKNFDRMINLTQKQMPGRMADVLLYFADVVYKNLSFKTTLTRQDIADMAAMSKESAIRVLKNFRDENIIGIDRNDFIILNLQALQSISKNG